MKKKIDVFTKLMSRLCRTKKYAGKYVAVIRDKLVVATGKNHFDTFRKARKIHPKVALGIYYVPTPEDALTVLCNIHTLK